MKKLLAKLLAKLQDHDSLQMFVLVTSVTAFALGFVYLVTNDPNPSDITREQVIKELLENENYYLFQWEQTQAAFRLHLEQHNCQPK